MSINVLRQKTLNSTTGLSSDLQELLDYFTKNFAQLLKQKNSSSVKQLKTHIPFCSKTMASRLITTLTGTNLPH